jgi:UDPglucose 6-dehydrogenase
MSSAAPRRIQRISVFGLGKLGSVVAGCHASRGFDVIGVDVVAEVVARVARCVPPVQEPDLERLYESSRGRLTASDDTKQAVHGSDLSLIVVPTPSHDDGSYDVRAAVRVCEGIGEALASKDGYHLVAMKSTVLPGDCHAQLIPALERTSGRRVGRDFGFCYSPEFIALGSVVRNLFHPDVVLLGESDERAGDLLAAVYRRVLGREPPLARMNIVNAELAKLAVNTYVTMKISFANSLARVCERLPGGNVDVVTHAIGADTRIGSKYLKGGLGFGGPCFPRDNRALLSLARRLGVPFHLAEATDAGNLDPARELVRRLADAVAAGSRVGLLGLSYKPDTAVVDHSQAILIAKELSARGFEVTAFDPLAIDAARTELGDQVKFAESGQAAIDGQQAVVIATPWREFAALDWSDPSGRGPLVFDCWGLLDEQAALRRVRLGAGPEPR